MSRAEGLKEALAVIMCEHLRYDSERGIILGISDAAEAMLSGPLAAALRSSGAGAEMRERAAKLVEYRAERARLAMQGGVDGVQFNRAAEATATALAAQIRALPLDGGRS